MTQVKDPKPSDVVAAVTWTAKPRGDAGLIEVPINVKFSNVPALSSRMSVLLTITSLDTPALFADQTYDGVVNSISTNENLDIALIPNESNARDLIEKYETEKAQKPVKNLFAKQVIESEGFELIKSPFVKFMKPEVFSKPLPVEVDLALVVENFGENGELKRSEAQALCAAYFQQKISSAMDARYTACLNNPSQVLRAEIREFVESVNSKPSNISFGRTENMKITAAFELSQGSSVTAGYDLEGSIAGNLDASVEGNATLLVK